MAFYIFRACFYCNLSNLSLPEKEFPIFQNKIVLFLKKIFLDITFLAAILENMSNRAER